MIKIGDAVIDRATGAGWMVVLVPSFGKVVCYKPQTELIEPFDESFWQNTSKAAYKEFLLDEVQGNALANK